MTSQADDVAQGAAKQVAERVHEARVSVGSRLGAEADTRSTAAGEQVGAATALLGAVAGWLYRPRHADRTA